MIEKNTKEKGKKNEFSIGNLNCLGDIHVDKKHSSWKAKSEAQKRSEVYKQKFDNYLWTVVVNFVNILSY